MDKVILDGENSALILSAAKQVIDAQIFRASTQKPFSVQTITLLLTTAQLSTNPIKIGFPFKSVYVSSATDTTVNINMQINTMDSYQSTIPFYLNDAWTSEHEIAEAFISWSAQSGKSITLTFFVDSEFRSGKQISVTGGGVSIVEGSTLTTSRVDLTAATATLIIAADSTRKNLMVQNNTGADVWLGGSSVSNTGANLGYRLNAGSDFIFKNTGTLYGYSVAGGTGDNGLLLFSEV